MNQERIKGERVNPSTRPYSQSNPSQVIFRSLPVSDFSGQEIADPVTRFCSRGPLLVHFGPSRKYPCNARVNVIRGRAGTMSKNNLTEISSAGNDAYKYERLHLFPSSSLNYTEIFSFPLMSRKQSGN